MGLLADAQRLNTERADEAAAKRRVKRAQLLDEWSQRIDAYSGYEATDQEFKKFSWLETVARQTSEQRKELLVAKIDDVTVAYGKLNERVGHVFSMVRQCSCGREFLVTLGYNTNEKLDMLGRRKEFVDNVARVLKQAECSYCAHSAPDDCPTCHRPWR